MQGATLEHLPPTDLQPPPFQTRTPSATDDADDADLTNSVLAHGVLEPIIARRVNGHLEIVAGARRHRAAVKAKAETVPVLIREDLDDARALEVQLIENDQRKDIHALDRAAGYKKLMDADPKYTHEEIARLMGRKPASVYELLRLLSLSEDGQKLLRDGTIEVGHAVRIARLSERDQGDVVKYIRQYAKSSDRSPSVREVKSYIAHHIKIDLFSPLVAEEQPAVAKKLAAWKEKGVEVLPLTRSWLPEPEEKKQGVVSPNSYREAGSKKCAHARPGAFVYGEEVELTTVCTEKGCKVHWPEVARQRREQAKAKQQAKESAGAREKRLKAEKAEKARKARAEAVRSSLLTAILSTVKAVSDEILRALVAMVAEAGQAVDFKEELEALGLYKPILTLGTTIRRDIPKVTGGLSPRQIAQIAVFTVVADRIGDDKELPKLAKEFGVDLKKLEKAIAAQTSAKAEPEEAASRASLGRAAGKKKAARKKR